MKILVYTFRTFPEQEILREVFGEIIVLGKLKRDLEIIYDRIDKEKPDLILGVARSEGKHSYFEPKTVNQFHKTSRIVKNGRFEFPLFIPKIEGKRVSVSGKTGDSFCNYSMYKIANFLEGKKIDTPFSFTHIRKEDISLLRSLLENAIATRHPVGVLGGTGKH